MTTTNETRKRLLLKDTRNLALWTGGWVMTMAIANFGPTFLWDHHTGLTITAILVNLGVGAGMILANIRHLKVLDEMQRKVAMDAMGISLGVAVVAGLAYSNLDITNIISYDAEISHLVILIGLTYLASTIMGNLRYK
ncbi:MAG: hypothetical protein RIF33_25855 [Cyclobacteriaceae bacterium]